MVDLYDGFDVHDTFDHDRNDSFNSHIDKERDGSGFNMNDSIRPMTSNMAAGYTSGRNKNKSNYQTKKSSSTHDNNQNHNNNDINDENKLSLKAEKMEKEVNKLLSQSIFSSSARDYDSALNFAQKSRKKDSEIMVFREKHNLEENTNVDLTFSVLFNLGYVYQLKKMYSESLNIYNLIINNNNNKIEIVSRIRLQIGNIYFIQAKYDLAIKMYRMSLDQIGDISYKLKISIMRNIGNAFLKLGQFVDAIQSFEHIVELNGGDMQTIFNLIISYYTLGDKEKMKKGFIQLLNCSLLIPIDENQINNNNNDEYSIYIKTKWLNLGNYIKQSVQLIGKAIANNNLDEYSGFNWLIDHLYQIKTKHESSNKNKDIIENINFFDKIILEIIVLKGIAYLKNNKFESTIEIFSQFNAENKHMNIYNNLSFINFLKCQYEESNKYALSALNNDRYNASSLVNRANCLYVYGEYESAKEMYLEAIGVEADCIEAIYNLGLICKKIGNYNDSLQAFKKLNKIDTDNPFIIYQICDLYQLLNQFEISIKWYKILHSVIPSDSTILIKLANLYKDYLKDETLIYHNYLDSYKLYKCNINIISWLGIWYINNSLYENAINIFKNAAIIQCTEIKWTLMIASCYRRMRNFQKAINIYIKILNNYDQNNQHLTNPNDMDIKIKCLQYLCTIMKQIHHPQLNKYQNRLNEELHQQQQHQLEHPEETQPPQQLQQNQQRSMIPNNNDNNNNNIGHEQEDDEDDNWADVDIDDELLPS